MPGTTLSVMLLRDGIVLTAVLAVAGGCAHLGINFDGDCSATATGVDTAEAEVMTTAARGLYTAGDLRLARETVLHDIWPHRLRAMHLEETPWRVPSEAVDDLEKRNARSGCLRVPEQELEVYAKDPGTRHHLTLSRPGFDRTGNAAILVYRLENGGGPGGTGEHYLILRRAPKRVWSVVNAVRIEP